MSEEANGTPMIEVEGLTKRYGRQTAIADLNFEVARGEIVGFLGPNGAGKSTTMRILSGFLSATSGSARVAGLDLVEDSIEVRRRVGYLPENNPLPDDMRVREFLKFRSRLKGLDRVSSRGRVDAVIEQFDLGEMANRMIASLSKGYRQRVGLADALVHEPELLILDEPTIGLDPHQIMSVRSVIKTLAAEHTVLISSHILPEMEVTCSRLFVFHKGDIVAADTQDNLQKRMGRRTRVIAEIDAPEEALRTLWEEMGEVTHYYLAPAAGEFRRCVLTVRDGVDLRPVIAGLAHEREWKIRELSESRPTLEDIFVQITSPEDEEEVLP